MFMLWRNDIKKRKKRTHGKEKMKHETKEKKEKKWCDWIWCNVTKILRINRKQKMWYKNHHKIFRKDAYVTWYRNMRVLVHHPHFMFAFMECRPTSNYFYFNHGALVWICWIDVILVIPKLHVYNIYRSRFMSKGFCKVNAQGKGKGNLAQVREINIHLYMLCIFKSPKQSLETCSVCTVFTIPLLS